VLDTKSKKMRRLKVLLITVTVLLPAVLLVALYPRMGQVYEQKVKELESQERAAELEEAVDSAEDVVAGTDSNTDVTYVLTDEEFIAEEYLPNGEIVIEDYLPAEEIIEETVTFSMESYPEEVPAEPEFELSSQFVNYAMEASYYLYGQMLQDTRETEVDISVLDQYGWINDYYTLADQCEFYAEYESDVFTKDSLETETLYRKKSDNTIATLLYEKGHSVKTVTERNMAANGCLGYLAICFDEYGNISDIRFVNFGNVYVDGGLYQHAKNSITQYESNVNYNNGVCGGI